MEQTTSQQHGDLYLQDGFWKLSWREDAIDANGFVEQHWRKPAWIGPATGPERLTKTEAEQIAWENFLSRSDQKPRVPQAAMTIADFVEKMFVPEHVAMKGLAGRTHYQAILKHVLTPEEVERVFRVDAGKSKAKLKAVADWPYLGHLRLCDVRPDHVQRVVSAAVAHGYSAQTVKHIRNVVSAIFAHARKAQRFAGENPASLVTLPEMTRKEAHTLTLSEAKLVLGVMQYPEKEMTLTAILTRMNVAEISGLQWKCVNLTEAWCNVGGEAIPPRTIAVRKQWHRGALDSVGRKSRNRNLPIPEPLLPILLGLSKRTNFTGPDDFIFVSRSGKPVNAMYIAAHRLKFIGNKLQMPWLSWQVFRRFHTTLAYELGMQLLGDRVSKETEGDQAPMSAPAQIARQKVSPPTDTQISEHMNTSSPAHVLAERLRVLREVDWNMRVENSALSGRKKCRYESRSIALGVLPE